MKTEQKIFAIIIGFIIITGAVALTFLKKFSAQTVSNQVIANADALVRPDSHKKGSDTAPVELVEFSDFQCPACGATEPLVEQMLAQYPDQVRLVYRNYPLSYHQHAMLAAQAAEAAGKQGKYWEMHDLLFARQKDWEENNDNQETFTAYATELGLDIEQFTTDMGSDDVKTKIAKDIADGNLINITGTPSFFINGKRTDGFATTGFNKLLEEALQANEQTN